MGCFFIRYTQQPASGSPFRAVWVDCAPIHFVGEYMGKFVPEGSLYFGIRNSKQFGVQLNFTGRPKRASSGRSHPRVPRNPQFFNALRQAEALRLLTAPCSFLLIFDHVISRGKLVWNPGFCQVASVGSRETVSMPGTPACISVLRPALRICVGTIPIIVLFANLRNGLQFAGDEEFAMLYVGGDLQCCICICASWQE